MINENYTVDILVNDKPLRKYPHNDKLFVEARKGTEYSIRIKNNSYSRILAVTSVDGLDTLTGHPAIEVGNGYVINGCNSLTIDGFRVSDSKVAKFLFDYKGNSYAASKKDGSERNVGVIGVRLFVEKVKPPSLPPIVIREEHHYHDSYPYHWGPNHTWPPYTITCGTGGTGLTSHYSAGGNMSAGQAMNYNSNINCDNTLNFADNSTPMKSSSPLRSMNMSSNPSPLGFDVGTKFGEAKESRVIEVEFEKGILALTDNIYYASRQSLIEMGVQMGNEKQVSFPEPFTDGKYAKPPMGWN